MDMLGFHLFIVFLPIHSSIRIQILSTDSFRFNQTGPCVDEKIIHTPNVVMVDHLISFFLIDNYGGPEAV